MTSYFKSKPQVEKKDSDRIKKINLYRAQLNISENDFGKLEDQLIVQVCELDSRMANEQNLQKTEILLLDLLIQEREAQEKENPPPKAPVPGNHTTYSCPL